MHTDFHIFPAVLFWKHPRRKLYAVTQRDLKEIRRRRSAGNYINTSDDESDDDGGMSGSTHKRVKLDNTLEAIGQDVSAIRETITEMMTLTADCSMPLGLKRVVNDTFKCYICHVIPVKPPIIVTKCCKNMLGCQECVNTWYSGPDAMLKTCPICWAERGCNETMVLRGLTEFLENIRKIHDNNENLARSENETDQN